MNNITISRFGVAELLNDEETINAYLNEALEDGTPDEFIQALDTVARAKKCTTSPQSQTADTPALITRYKATSQDLKCSPKH